MGSPRAAASPSSRLKAIIGSAAAAYRCRRPNGSVTPTARSCCATRASSRATSSDENASTASLEQGGWLRTGDIIEILDNGEIAVVDRKKAIIITAGGKNIAPSEIENALKDSEFIKEAIVVGEAKKYLGAIIQVDYDNVGRWARDRALAYTNYKSLSQLPEVNELVERVVNETNKRFARVENIRRFAILEKELDHDDGELTATQKVRRAMIEKKFARELAIIYRAEG
ncbi:hypothetical protein [Bradyrhizobium elkanii]